MSGNSLYGDLYRRKELDPLLNVNFLKPKVKSSSVTVTGRQLLTLVVVLLS